MSQAPPPDDGRDSSPPQKPLASWYAQGLSDGVGDRLLMFDNSDAPSLELLRVRPELASAPGFEEALRERVQRLSRFRHPSFARVRAVENLEPDDGLAVVSNYTPGKRLSELLAPGKRTTVREGSHPAAGAGPCLAAGAERWPWSRDAESRSHRRHP